MSDTPRTDELCKRKGNDWTPSEGDYIDLCEDLERELSRLRAEVAALRDNDAPVRVDWMASSDVLSIINAAREGRWSWTKNSRCKYIELRVDMRDGACILRDREGKLIRLETLAYQFAPDAARALTEKKT